LIYFVANQQTVVELIGFFQRAFPQSAAVQSSVTRHVDHSEPRVIDVRRFAVVLCRVSEDNLLDDVVVAVKFF